MTIDRYLNQISPHCRAGAAPCEATCTNRNGPFLKSSDSKPLLQGIPRIILLGQEKRKEKRVAIGNFSTVHQGGDSDRSMPHGNVEAGSSNLPVPAIQSRQPGTSPSPATLHSVSISGLKICAQTPENSAVNWPRWQSLLTDSDASKTGSSAAPYRLARAG
jgi:hypothetical protein